MGFKKKPFVGETGPIVQKVEPIETPVYMSGRHGPDTGNQQLRASLDRTFQQGPALIEGSPQQEAIWDKLVNTEKHLVVQALAGCGKTFTVVQGLHRLGSKKAGRCAFVAFNKSIATELQKKVPQWCEASTFHSMLFSRVKDFYGWKKCKVENYKTSNILEWVMGEPAFQKAELMLKIAVEKLVGLCKNTLTAPDEKGIEWLCERYGVELNGNRAAVLELVPEVLRLSAMPELQWGIDFDDMIWLPVVEPEIVLPQFNFLAVDEAQDLNRVQQVVLAKMAASETRVMLVGDENQAIYGFRGADANSMANMIHCLYDIKYQDREHGRGVEVLPLTYTRRCPKAHVELAKQIVPSFEALPESPEGEVIQGVTEEKALLEMKPGDLVVCRVNAPIVSMAFKLLKIGVRANIQGRDIGKGLKALIRKLNVGIGPGTVSALIVKLMQYTQNEIQKIRGQKRPSESKITNLEDKQSCILAFCDGAEDVEVVNRRIDDMFTDASDGEVVGKVLLSSVHRAKGLEADVVWILRPDLMPHKMATQDWELVQEGNIKYVSLTRSKRKLVIVAPPETVVKEE